MRKLFAIAAVALIATVAATTAQAHVGGKIKSDTPLETRLQIHQARLKHAETTLRFFAKHEFLKTKVGTRAIARSKILYAKALRKWAKAEIKKLDALLNPAFSRDKVHPCLRDIIDAENPRWDPQAWNYQGSGAYGLPQALPGHKMASAGSDWRTNPWTQIKWMMSYTITRYGGPCEARSARFGKGWY